MAVTVIFKRYSKFKVVRGMRRKVTFHFANLLLQTKKGEEEEEEEECFTQKNLFCFVEQQKSVKVEA